VKKRKWASLVDDFSFILKTSSFFSWNKLKKGLALF
jgi:hypothetical protein